VLPPARELLLFAGRFAALLALLLIPWRAVGYVYSAAFGLTATAALQTTVDDRQFQLRFEPTDDPWGVRFSGTEVRTGKRSELPIEAREIGYVPAATLVALVFAWRADGQRRRRALLWGMAVISVRVVLAVGLPVAHFVGALGAGGWMNNVALTVFEALIEPPDMAYATPLIAFLLVLGLSRPSEDPSLRAGSAVVTATGTR
jgi:hypothetical protein